MKILRLVCRIIVSVFNFFFKKNKPATTTTVSNVSLPTSQTIEPQRVSRLQTHPVCETLFVVKKPTDSRFVFDVKAKKVKVKRGLY